MSNTEHTIPKTEETPNTQFQIPNTQSQIWNTPSKIPYTPCHVLDPLWCFLGGWMIIAECWYIFMKAAVSPFPRVSATGQSKILLNSDPFPPVGDSSGWLPNSTDLYYWYIFISQNTNTEGIAGKSARIQVDGCPRGCRAFEKLSRECTIRQPPLFHSGSRIPL